MQPSEELINELADLYGIIPEYWDVFGIKHTASLDIKKAILKAMNLDIDSEDAIKKEIFKKRNYPWTEFIEPVNVVSFNEQPFKISIYLPIEEKEQDKAIIFWSIYDEESKEIEEFFVPFNELIISGHRFINGRRYIEIKIIDKCRRDIGYYSVDVKFIVNDFQISSKTRVIIAPDQCYIPPELENKRKWGLSINLYSIRSNRNFGVGDLGDLKEIVKWIAELGGSFVGINPLHAIPNKRPFGISPYSPITRLYKNFIYLDIENIEDVKRLISDDLWRLSNAKEIEDQINELRNMDFIDYENVASLKENILRQTFALFYEKLCRKFSTRFDIQKHLDLNSCSTTDERVKDFIKYISEEGNLESFASFLSKSSDEKEILFYKYVQWLIDEQLKEISKMANNLGMPIGIYHDLAIGSIGEGSDVFNFREIFADGIDLGAPPDDFNPKGQNWGLPPLIPNKLKDSGYEFFIQLIRKNMKHFGALRIDHALGLFRQFWIPRGYEPKDGAYVKQSTEDLLRIIALESVRNQTVVIAEDLGTVGENVRESLFRFRMLSYRLLYFERNYPDPSFTPPERYPEMALCAVTTHDLPTIYGWWSGRDIELKKRLGIFLNDDVYQRHIDERKRDKGLLINALKALGIVSDNSLFFLDEMNPDLCLAIYEYIASTPCKLLSISLDDCIGTLDQQNMPGVTDSYPSWLQKTPISLKQIIENKWFKSLSDMLHKGNRC